MNIRERINILSQLGIYLNKIDDEFLYAVMKQSEFHNAWFSIENQKSALQSIANQFLDEKKLVNWLESYQISEPKNPKTVGLVMAGNIPLVGFQDWLCVFVTGHRAQIKLSDKDKFMFPHLVKMMQTWNPNVTKYIEFVNILKDFEAVIATGSNNTARYFESYFGKYPNIIRKNRNSIAILDGSETKKEFAQLGADIFQYFGLGCRNVSKIYLPKGYDFQPLLEALHEFNYLIMNSKYKNNFDYNYALYILNRTKYEANGCILMTENESLNSRIANLNFEYYSDMVELSKKLNSVRHEIQCVVSKNALEDFSTMGFGKTQKPTLADYPDGIDVINFLQKLD